MSDAGHGLRSESSQGPSDDSGSSEGQRSARREMRSILRSYFTPLSPFAGWRGIKTELVEVAREPFWGQLLLAGWIIGSFLLVVPYVVMFVVSLLRRVLPTSVVFHPVALIAVFAVVPLAVSIVLPLLVVNWLHREGAKEDVRDLQGWLPKEAYWYEGGDGSSLDQAVVLRGNLRGRRAFVAATLWLVARHGDFEVGWDLVNRRPLAEGKRQIEEWVIRLANGEEKRIYFDVTASTGED